MMKKVQASALHGWIVIAVVTIVFIAIISSLCALGVLENAFGFGCIAVVCTFASKATDIYINVANKNR